MEQSRAFTFLTIKAVDEGRRIIRGIASTPEPDRDGDIVEPLGALFGKNLPLLWMHRHDLPVGTVNFGTPTKDGIPFEATLPVVAEPSQLKARIDEAWQSVKAGLVRAVSIGFKPLEYSFIDETGGLRFTKIEIYELSLVTVPANGGASITEIKFLDRKLRFAALGNMKHVADQSPKKSGVSEISKSIVKLNPREDHTMSISEKIKQFQDELAAKNQKVVELAEKSANEGQTFDDADKEAFDTLTGEVKALQEHINRLEVAETAQKAAAKSAKPVPEKAGNSEEGASNARSGANIQVKAAAEAIPGLAMARIAKCKALARIHQMPASEIAKQLYDETDPRISKVLQKAAVAAGTTTNGTWAGPLVPEESGIYADFAVFLRPATILGKFGTGNIPALRTVPFRTRLLSQTSGGDGYWTGEGNAKGLTQFDFAGTSLDPLKVASIAVITKELAMDSNPSAETLVRDSLRDALVARLDSDFIDPAITSSANVRPASITNGVSQIPSVGNDAEAIRCDVRALLATYVAANNPPTTGVIIMSSLTALALSMMQNPLGQPEFPGLTMNGGLFLGFPTIVSEYVPSDSSGSFVFMVNASDIYYGDGEITLDMSDQASLQMDSTPDNPTTASTVMVSLWQRNMIGFLVEKRVNWSKRRSSAVAVLSAVNWGACAST